MPCYDGTYREEQRKQTEERINFLEASLCSTLTAIEKIQNHLNNFYSEYNTVKCNLLDWIDYEEAGIKEKDLKNWWKEHKAKDIARRKKEAEEKENLKANALRKLTQKEREALGF